MHIYSQIYELAASAGALEGYVYRRDVDRIDSPALSGWIANLQRACELLPADARRAIQPGLDRTVGRAIRSLELLYAPDHPDIRALRSITAGDLPSGPDDFTRVKWFEEKPDGS